MSFLDTIAGAKDENDVKNILTLYGGALIESLTGLMPKIAKMYKAYYSAMRAEGFTDEQITYMWKSLMDAAGKK